MGFDSLGFYLLLSMALVLFAFTRRKAFLLLAFSFVFYAFFSLPFLALLIALATMNHFAALGIGSGRLRNPWFLACFVALNLGPLLALKIGGALEGKLFLPLGLSFYSFHCLSYLIDVYRGVTKPEPRLTHTLLYISFFPQLIAGPITRANEILPQLRNLELPAPERVQSGFGRIFLGLFKKFVIANVLAGFVTAAFAAPESFGFAALFLAVLAGRYFIFADFSAYTDIAVGSARLMGIELPENFRRPFAATSIADYWRRWHVTLSSWIRDYLYYPLLLSPVARLGIYPLIVLTFLALGFWHGASVNFLLYGLWHGLLIVAYHLSRPVLGRWVAWLPEGKMRALTLSLFTYVVLVCPPTVLFLTHSLDQASQVFSSLLAAHGGKPVWNILGPERLTSVLAGILALELFQWKNAQIVAWLERRTLFAKSCLGVAGLFVLLWMGDFSGERGFVYFRF